MATRKNLKHDDNTRAKIQTSQLVNRLTKHVLGEVDMSSSQVSAALGLIKKRLPDLAAVHNTGGDKEQTLEEWLDELPEATETKD